CAAAISSSGLVLPSGLSVRAAKVTGSCPTAPLPTVTVPLPWVRLPFQTTAAVRSANAMGILLALGASVVAVIALPIYRGTGIPCIRNGAKGKGRQDQHAKNSKRCCCLLHDKYSFWPHLLTGLAGTAILRNRDLVGTCALAAGPRGDISRMFFRTYVGTPRRRGSVATVNRAPTFWRNFGLILGVNVLWVPLSMLFNSLQTLGVQVSVLHFATPEQKGTVLGLILFAGLLPGALIQPLVG